MTRVETGDIDRNAMAGRMRDQVRSRMKATRRALPLSAIAERSERIVRTLADSGQFLRAKGVALFWPIDGDAEVDLRSLDAPLRERGVRVYYPFMDERVTGGFVTGFRLTAGPGQLERRGRRFAQPPPTAPVARAGDIDLVVVPALAVTPTGARLGYGIGFYDATLPDVRPPAIAVAVAFSFQLVMELPAEPHDVDCDAVVTDEHLFDPRGLLQSA